MTLKDNAFVRIRLRRFIILSASAAVILSILLVQLIHIFYPVTMFWMIIQALLVQTLVYFISFKLCIAITNHCADCSSCWFSRILHVPMGGSIVNDECSRTSAPAIIDRTDRYYLIEVPISRRKLPGYILKNRVKITNTILARIGLRLKDKVFTEDFSCFLAGSIVVTLFLMGVSVVLNIAMARNPSFDILITSAKLEVPLTGAILWNATVIDIPDSGAILWDATVSAIPDSLDGYYTSTKLNGLKSALSIENYDRLIFIEVDAHLVNNDEDIYVRGYRLWYSAEPVTRTFFTRRTIPCYINKQSR